ncbi:MAG: MerR family transcriptional regulator [Solirubrobacteraceae bacterium]|nr:MerR family transcriptional regulator [Solirubrobacteraceae bacterium]
MAVNRLTFTPITPELREAFNPFPAGPPAPGPEGPFRIGELSRHSGVPVGTIKYYLREGLLPPGEATARTQALYGAEHLRRLRVIGVLADVGGLSIAQLRRVAAVIDAGESVEPPSDPLDLTRAVSYALPSPGRPGSRTPEPEADGPSDGGRGLAEARIAADGFVDSLGLEVAPDAPARADLAEALHALWQLGIADDPMSFYEHARLAYELAEIEIAITGPVEDPARSAEAVTVGSVIFGAAFMALRRMSHEHEMRRRVDAPVSTDPDRGPIPVD